MAEAVTKLPVRTETSAPKARSSGLAAWQPIDTLRGEIDRIFEDFSRGFWPAGFGRRFFDLEPALRREAMPGYMAPAVDVAEHDKEYLITAELPGLDDKNVELSVVDDVLTVKGEKHEEKEDKDKNYYMSERRYGSFRRSFQLPTDVDQNQIEASFQKGVLTVTLPKTPEAQKKQKKIEIKSN